MSQQQIRLRTCKTAAAANALRGRRTLPSPLLLAVFFTLALLAAPKAAAAFEEDANLYEIRGRVSTAPDGVTPVPLPPGAAIEVVLTTDRGARSRTFAAKDGAFVLRGVPPGGHTVAPLHPKLVFPEVRIDVGRDGGLKRAALTFNGAQIPVSPAFVIPAAGVAQYYEVRRAFDLVGFLKTPYGLMLAFSVFAIVVMPMLKVRLRRDETERGFLGGGA
jgi:hypothetical protein